LAFGHSPVTAASRAEDRWARALVRFYQAGMGLFDTYADPASDQREHDAAWLWVAICAGALEAAEAAYARTRE
jgi:hypothetical protein